jgi:hypothetical protein
MMPLCSNGVCEAGETSATCPADCPVSATCGNKKCEPGEELRCGVDCCGDGVCAWVERYLCPADCGTTCGDNVCQRTDVILCAEECPMLLRLPLDAPETASSAP